MLHQSPIAPGLSLYQETAGARKAYLPLDGSRQADAVVIGGGFTGLHAAYHMASAGLQTVLVDAARFGDGASGRNGGQMGTGQREWPEDREKEIGFERAKALFDLAERAKAHVLDFARDNAIDMDYRPGQFSVAHKARYVDDYRRHADILAERFDYPHARFMDRAETVERLGSTHYRAGVRDTGTGHIHPLKFLIGTARAAEAAGAALHEQTAAETIERKDGKAVVTTPNGTITADHALIACNGYIAGLEPTTTAHVMPIRSFIGATPPLDPALGVLPGGESVDDSRFVVRYFRRNPEGRLLFGGRETYSSDAPRDIAKSIRRQMTQIFPRLRDTGITHAWGGTVGITMPRRPFVREVKPGIVSIGGFSGHGVVLSAYSGKLFADAVTGKREEFSLLEELAVPSFPGGARFAKPLLFLAMSWFALRDRF